MSVHVTVEQLPAHLARWANVGRRGLYELVTIGFLLDETWAFCWFGSVMEAVLMLLVVRYAWSWPQVTAVQAEAPATQTVTSRA